jgi:hypothetical protein
MIKSFTQLIMVLSFVIGGAFWSPSALADPAIRLSWEEFSKDPARVESLRQAVRVMKSKNNADPKSVDYRSSWNYWANMHGYYGTGSSWGTVEQAKAQYPQYAAYFAGIPDMTPPDAVAQAVWNQCQHGTPWFYAWHRFYLYYFEKTLQVAANDPNLRLPYWDYTNPSYLNLPDAFQKPTYVNAQGKTVDNPLYEAKRAPSWANPATKLDPNSTNIDQPLKNDHVLLGPGRYQNKIENGVHGYIHCTVGVTCPIPDMGAIAYSANDPIFWLHHANIDRTWSCWSNIAGNKNPTDDQAFVTKTFSFVDGTGQEVTNVVSQLFDGTFIDYRYQQETNCQRVSLVASAGASVQLAQAMTNPIPDPGPEKIKTLSAPEAKALFVKPFVLNKVSQPMFIDKLVTKSRQKIGGAANSAQPLALFKSATPSVETRTELVLSGISYENHPGTMFNVYLEDPANTKTRVYVGTLNFFSSQLGHVHQDGNPADGESRSFDVTEALHKLIGNKAGAADVNVVFAATTGRLGTKDVPVLAAKAKLQVKSIEFSVKLADE